MTNIIRLSKLVLKLKSMIHYSHELLHGFIKKVIINFKYHYNEFFLKK